MASAALVQQLLDGELEAVTPLVLGARPSHVPVGLGLLLTPGDRCAPALHPGTTAPRRGGEGRQEQSVSISVT